MHAHTCYVNLLVLFLQVLLLSYENLPLVFEVLLELSVAFQLQLSTQTQQHKKQAHNKLVINVYLLLLVYIFGGKIKSQHSECKGE